MGLFLDNHDIVQAFLPVDLQTAQTGDYVNLASWGHVAVLFCSALGSGGDDPVVNCQQATDNGGTGVKDLDISTSPVKVFSKQAATSLTGVTTWSDASGSVTGGNTFDEDGTSAEESLLLLIEFDANELDVANGFDHMRITVDDTGSNAQLGCAFYILSEPRFALAPTSKQSPL